MLKITFALWVILAVLVNESTSQRFIQPTYRPPRTQKPILRRVREAGELTLTPTDDAPKVHNLELLDRNVRSLDSPSAKRGGGSHSTSSGNRNTGATHPGYNRRNARGVDSPSARRGGGNTRSSSGSRDTGPTHPGYNRRNAREIRLTQAEATQEKTGHLNPLPKPLYPRPTIPAPVLRIPIYARKARDIQIPGMKKPSYRDVIIPNWNPNVNTNPWDSLGGRGRQGRSIDFTEDMISDVEVDDLPHDRLARDLQITGLPRKPTHRDVIIPNWNPHARTKPWQTLGGGSRHH